MFFHNRLQCLYKVIAIPSILSHLNSSGHDTPENIMDVLELLLSTMEFEANWTGAHDLEINMLD